MHIQKRYIVKVCCFLFSDCDDVTTRKWLDQRWLEEAHLKYCVLDVYQRYTEVFSTQVISHSLQQMLHDITPLLHKAFSAEFAGTYIFVTGLGI